MQERQMVEIRVFLAVLTNAGIVSTTAPQYQPSYLMKRL